MDFRNRGSECFMEAAMQRVWAVLVMVLAVGSPAKAANDSDKQGAQTTLYVSLSGKDSAGGKAPGEAVATLRQAIEMYRKDCSGKYRIVVGPGEYKGEELTLKRAACPLRIEPANKGERPRFVGKGDGTWLRIAAPGAKMIDLEITGL